MSLEPPVLSTSLVPTPDLGACGCLPTAQKELGREVLVPCGFGVQRGVGQFQTAFRYGDACDAGGLAGIQLREGGSAAGQRDLF